jgi:all-trans-8'-apo-beta-carotenal 15,15'-oxygenase
MEILDGSGFEFPLVSPRVACHPHRYGYLATESTESFAWSGLARVDRESGRIDRHTFPAGHYNGEAVFVPDPAQAPDLAAGREPGWLLSEVYDGGSRRSYLAILDAEHVSDGPVATVRLEHHVPLSFHGWWTPTA